MTWANRLNFLLISATVIFTALAYGAVHQPVIALFYLIVAAMLILWAVDAWLSGTLRFSKSQLQIPVLAAAVYGFIQIIPFGTLAETAGISGIPRTISGDPFSTQLTALHFLALFIFFAVSLVLIDSATKIHRLVRVITIFGFVFAFFAILQSVLSPNKIYGIYERQFLFPFGSFISRNNFAAFMEMSLALPLGLIFVGAVKRDKRLLYITAIALMGISLLLSGSRGGFVALIAEIIVMLILTTRAESRKKLALKIGLSVALIAAVIGGSIFVGGESSLSRLAEPSASKELTTDRPYIWKVTLRVITHNMPFGAGLGTFATAYTPHDKHSGLERVEQAHNDFLQVAADAGIVGVIIGLFFLYRFFRIGIRNSSGSNTYRRGIAVGAFSGCTAILVHSIFDFVLHTTAISVLFLTVLALLSASGQAYEDDAEEIEPWRFNKPDAGSVTSISEGRRRQRK